MRLVEVVVLNQCGVVPLSGSPHALVHGVKPEDVCKLLRPDAYAVQKPALEMATRPSCVLRNCFDADPPLALLQSRHGTLERWIAFVVCAQPLAEPGLEVCNTILF